MATTSVLSVRGLVRDFRRTRALAGLDLSVAPGEVYGLLGNNGAGKTTTLHVLLGLLRPTAGTVSVVGLEPWRSRVEVLRRVGFFSELDQPYGWLRVRQLLRVGELTYPSWDQAFAQQLCGQFELDLEKKVQALSKGMLAKAKLVMALAHRPKVLILDEPTAGLDPGSRHELLGHLRHLTSQAEVTVLFSSHNLDDVERIATRVGIIDQGILRLELARDEVRRMAVFRFDTSMTFDKAAAPLAAESRQGLWQRYEGDAWEILAADPENPALAPVLGRAVESGQRMSTRPATLMDLFVFVTTRRSMLDEAVAS